MYAFWFVCCWIFVSLIGDTGKGGQEDGVGVGIRVGQTRSEGVLERVCGVEGGKMEGGTR